MISRLNLLAIATTSIAIGLVCIRANPARAVNLVANGNFTSFNPLTNAPNSWDSFGTVVSRVDATTINVANITLNGGISQQLNTVKGNSYQVSFDLYTPISTDLSNYQVAITETQLGVNIPLGLRLVDLTLDRLVGTKKDDNFTTYRFNFADTIFGFGLPTISFSNQLPPPTTFPFTNPTSSTNFSLTNVVVDLANPTPTAVPEPLTIIGTIIGGTAAMRMRKKLKTIVKKKQI